MTFSFFLLTRFLSIDSISVEYIEFFSFFIELFGKFKEVTLIEWFAIVIQMMSGRYYMTRNKMNIGYIIFSYEEKLFRINS